MDKQFNTEVIEKLIPKFVKKIDVVLELEGVRVLDRQAAELLKLIDVYGSLFLASKVLGISYSRAWERVNKIEHALGIKIVKRRRGGVRGGGTSLTPEGKYLLSYYEELLKEYGLRYVTPVKKLKAYPQLMVVGSHDIILEIFLGYLRKNYGMYVETSWVGSSGGLTSLMLNEADIAPVHLYDPSTNTYNVSYLKNYWLENKVIVVKGFQREMVFAYHPNLSFNNLEDILNSLIKGNLTLVNRNVGSGTRVLLDFLIKKYCEKHELSFGKIIKSIKGYENEVRTHLDVAKAIASGEADVGLLLRYCGELYKLKYIHVKWENYDFVILKDRLRNKYVRIFINELKSVKLKNVVNKYVGYKIPPDIGTIYYT